MKKRLTQLWVLLPILVLGISGAAAWQILHSSQKTTTCIGQAASDFSCWQKHYNQLVANKTPEAAFTDFKANYDSNAFVKSSCHQIGHVIGRAAAKKYATLAETYAHGDNFCWSGYYHGAIETVAQKLGPNKIISQINTVCASFLKSKPEGFDHYNCVHGMGHGLMAVQGDDLFKALSSCDSFDGSWQQESCYSGVFMENVMNEINPGEHSKYLKSDDPLYPCTAVADRYKQQCYFMQTSHALIVENYDYTKVFSLCEGLGDPFNVTCYQSLGRDVSGQSSSDAKLTLERCMLGTSQLARENCFTGAVKDFISYYHSDQQGLALCKAIPDAALADSCHTQAVEYYKSF
ncbi:MAG TPA: hypothetical protein VLH38_05630 [Patescibacteria group bacterium]|nr:hypothetical protein [Patescibacteria group bacterium]